MYWLLVFGILMPLGSNSANPATFSQFATKYVIDSTECRARSSCDQQLDHDELNGETFLVSTSQRNCMCDSKCRFYDDCCHDYQTQRTNDTPSLKAVASCLSLPEVDHTGPVYVVNRCPDSRHIDDRTRKRCEAETGQLNRLPVVGIETGVLYRNAFCAVCNSEDYIYWVAKLELCTTNITAPDSNRKNISDLLSASLQNGCQVTFHPDEQTASLGREWNRRKKQDFMSLTSVTRRCRQHVLSRCDRKWLDRQTNRMCRDGPTSHVFAGRRTFRNRYCAVCNHVNETYLQCTSTTPVDSTEIDRYSYGANRSEPFILINMNDKQAMLHLTNSIYDNEDENDYEMHSNNSLILLFPPCSNITQIYDPFKQTCFQPQRLCRPGSTFISGRCTGHRKENLTELLVRSGIADQENAETHEEKILSTTGTTQSSKLFMVSEKPQGGSLRIIKENDYIRFSNDSFYVFSLQRAYTKEQCHYKENENPDKSITCDDASASSPIVINSHSPLTMKPFRLSMFRLGLLERLASIIATLIGVVAYLASLLGACVFQRSKTGRQSCDTAAKCAVCLLVCLFCRHVGYLAVVLSDSLQSYFQPATKMIVTAVTTDRVCFFTTAFLQYTSLAAFFWLNVLTVEVYRRLSSNKSFVHPMVDFVFYSLYAWLIPAIAVGWSIAVEVLGIDSLSPSLQTPTTDDSPNSFFNSSTKHTLGEISSQPTDCWVLNFIQLLLFILPAALTTVVDVVLFIITGCQKCIGYNNGKENVFTENSMIPKKLATTDEHLPQPWRRNIPDKQVNDNSDESPNTFSGCQRAHAENLYICCIQITLLMSMTWVLCFMASTLPGAPHSLLWYLYVVFDVSLALTSSLAFLTTEQQIWQRLLTRQKQWDQLPSIAEPRQRYPRITSGPGDVIVVESIAGWSPGSPTLSNSEEVSSNSPAAGVAQSETSVDIVHDQDNSEKSLKFFMKETSI